VLHRCMISLGQMSDGGLAGCCHALQEGLESVRHAAGFLSLHSFIVNAGFC
jgi:hypothetical protein